MSDVHPWNLSLWERLISNADRLPHGLLFSGPVGMGKYQIAMKLAQRELCDTGEGCGTCQSCVLFEAGTAPDLHFVASEVYSDALDDRGMSFAGRYQEERKERKARPGIVIDQVRALIDALNTRPHISRSKVAIVVPAEAMNINAANSLLKVLEEPTADTRLILITQAPRRLLPTIRSRSMVIDFRPPDVDVAIQWLVTQGVKPEVAPSLLRQTGEAPLAALEMSKSGFGELREKLTDEVLEIASGSRSPVQAAEEWKNTGPKPVLDTLVSVMDEWLRSSQGGVGQSRLQQAGQGLDFRKMHEVRGELARAASTWDTSLDATLVLEGAFITIRDLRT